MNGENSQVKISSELSADDFNKYLITACDQQNITPVTTKCVYYQEYQPRTVFFYELLKLN